ncbi:hypothetical protein K439DRAFT_1618226 [Ramaria rubella]|nr:hypothetical protein K439DRAFT_1618226 [Ramaria rubella]
MCHIPALNDFLNGDHDEGDIKTMAACMCTGQDGACSDDTSALKKQIPDILHNLDRVVTSDLNSKDKATSYASCSSQGNTTCNLQTGLCKGHEYDSNDEMKGLLKGELLVHPISLTCAGFQVHIPRAICMDQKQQEVENHTLTQGCIVRDGLSYQLITCICSDPGTFFIIHWFESQTYFGLLSNENNQKSGGAFELSTLYWQIMHLLEDSDLKEEADDLLLWWNRQIFPSKSSAKSATQKELDPIAKLKAQKAAKRAVAFQDATNNQYEYLHKLEATDPNCKVLTAITKNYTAFHRLARLTSNC